MEHETNAKKAEKGKQGSTGKTATQRKYKDRLFCRLFSEKENAMSLYNAVNETNYTDIDNLEIVTLEDVLYLSMKNDLAIYFHDCLDLFEQQSTINPNMPIRGLLYFARELEGWLSKQDTSIYSKKLIQIPTPEYYVLYNGSEKMPERQELCLSSAFGKKVTGYEWTAYVLNINSGHNKDIMKRCRILSDYSKFINTIEKHRKKGDSIEQAITVSINECINKGILAEYLRKHKAEVKGMVLTEFNQKLYEEELRKEEREEGRKEGMLNGRFVSVKQLMLNAHMSEEEAMRALNFSPEEKNAYEKYYHLKES